MRDHVRGETADEVLLDALCNTEVAVVSDAANLASHSAQTAAVTAATLIARTGASIHLDLPTTMCGLQPSLRSLELNEALQDLGQDLLPERNPFQIGAVDREVDVAVIIGSSPWRGRARQVLRLTAEPWAALMQPAEIVAPWQAHDWPFGGLGAGALAAGEAFKAAMRKLRKFSASPVFDETFAPTPWARLTLAPPLTPTVNELGRIDLISGGAIAHAMLFVLARIPGVAGDLRVVDAEVSDALNLNRYQLLRVSDVGSSKVKHLERLDLKEIRLRPIETRFDRDTARQLRPLASVVLAGVDHIPSRWAIQREAANWLSIAATSHYSAMASFHIPGLPCAGCLQPHDDVQDGPIPTVAFVSFLGRADGSRVPHAAFGGREFFSERTTDLFHPHCALKGALGYLQWNGARIARLVARPGVAKNTLEVHKPPARPKGRVITSGMYYWIRSVLVPHWGFRRNPLTAADAYSFMSPSVSRLSKGPANSGRVAVCNLMMLRAPG